VNFDNLCSYSIIIHFMHFLYFSSVWHVWGCTWHFHFGTVLGV